MREENPAHLIRSPLRALAGAALGAVAGAVCVVALYWLDPSVTLHMDRDPPRRVASGFFPVERAGEQLFAWTSAQAQLRLDGVSREVSWECSVRFRGGRSDPTTLPEVALAVDGIVQAQRTATNEYEELTVTVSPRPAPGVRLTIASSNTFVPGPSDRRELGIQVAGLDCRPADAAFVLPPRTAMRNAAVAAALFGAAFAWSGIPIVWALALGMLVVLGQAVLLTTGLAPYGPYPARLMVFAGSVAAGTAGLLTLLDSSPIAGFRRRRDPNPPGPAAGRLADAARFVVLFSGAVFYLKVLGLLHPGKLIIDALFHAHRLGWVLDGRYYFTQPMPGGVTFPYAIGLYVFAAPWSFVTSDYVTLLRVVVTSAEVAAGALLYVLVARIWGDRLLGVLAVVFFHQVPLAYGILGNANLTNVFGQAAALAALAAAATLQPGLVRLAGFLLVCSLAFLSHISTFAVLSVTLLALAALYWLLGGPDLRATARSVLAVTLVAAAVSVVAYYGHFGEVYATALRARTQAAAPAEPGGTQAEPPTARLPAATPMTARLLHSAGLTVVELGWPMLILALAGILHLGAYGARDRLGLLLGAWGVAYAVFFGVGVLMRVDAPFERYAAEFVGRVNLAMYPAVAVLAARGAAWGWRAGAIPRLASVLLLLFALQLGWQHWRGWVG